MSGCTVCLAQPSTAHLNCLVDHSTCVSHVSRLVHNTLFASTATPPLTAPPLRSSSSPTRAATSPTLPFCPWLLPSPTPSPSSCWTRSLRPPVRTPSAPLKRAIPTPKSLSTSSHATTIPLFYVFIYSFYKSINQSLLHLSFTPAVCVRPSSMQQKVKDTTAFA